MNCILSNNLDPYYNLAAEEYFLKNRKEEFFILWRCNSTIVVGKHQNTLAEINFPFIRKNNIKVARRITGGGTVFHDTGNINFTFISQGDKGKLVDFKRFVTPVIEILNSMGVRAEQGNKNEILVGGKKISGNAEHVHKTRILHHGTLLFNSELNTLNEALKVIPGKYVDKSVQSNRSEVTNIRQHLNKDMSSDEFLYLLFESFKAGKKDYKNYKLTEKDSQSILNLANEKYNGWGWIFGYSPRYKFENKVMIDNYTVGIEMNIENGIIQSVLISGNYFTNQQSAKLAEMLSGKRHKFEEILNIVELNFETDLSPIEIDRLCYTFF